MSLQTLINKERYYGRRFKLARIYFWVCIEYVHNCHESGELQGFAEIKNNNINNSIIFLVLDKALCD